MLNTILSCTYPAYPLHDNNVSRHYVFENWLALDECGLSTFTLLHASFDCVGPAL